MNELFVYQDENGKLHSYYGPPVERKLGDMGPLIEAANEQEKQKMERSAMKTVKLIGGPLHHQTREVSDDSNIIEIKVLPGCSLQYHQPKIDEWTFKDWDKVSLPNDPSVLETKNFVFRLVKLGTPEKRGSIREPDHCYYYVVVEEKRRLGESINIKIWSIYNSYTVEYPEEVSFMKKYLIEFTCGLGKFLEQNGFNTN